MRYIIDTEKLTITPITESKPRNLADIMKEWEGAREYEGIVAEIQKWYYGYVLEDAWCATSVSYAAHLAGGEIEKQVGKYENVDRMKDHLNQQNRLDCTKNYGGGAYIPKVGDLVFFSIKYSYKDCTHVGAITAVNASTGRISVISGNCDDMVKTKDYNYFTDRYVVAFGNLG